MRKPSKTKRTGPRQFEVSRPFGLQPEVKVFDSSVNQSYDYNGLIVPLSDVTQGSGPNSRSGNVIHPLSLDYDLRHTVGATSPVTCRVLLARLLLPESGLAVGDLINNTGSGLITQAQYNMETHGQSQEDRRIEILRDMTFTVSTNYEPVAQQKGSISLRNDDHGLIRYSGSTVAPIYGALVLVVCSTLAGPSGLPAASGTFRVKFLDC